MQKPVVDVKNLDVRFGDFYAVRDVSFDVGAGEIFGFLGANGAGKTTTIRVLCGLIAPSAGRVVVDGLEFLPQNRMEIKKHVGYMSQKFTLYDELSINENFDFAGALRSMPRNRFAARRDQLLDFIGFDRDLHTVVHNLPGGIKQEIALCIALLDDPKIIFLDEPTAGVSPARRMRFWELIRMLARAGKTVFVTTHYMDEAENCHRVALMRAGELIALDSPENLKRKTFGDSLLRFTPRRAGAKLPPRDQLDVCEPYGMHWHVRFKNNDIKSMVKKYRPDFEISHIAPSLEDVFIKLVQGAGR